VVKGYAHCWVQKKPVHTKVHIEVSSGAMTDARNNGQMLKTVDDFESFSRHINKGAWCMHDSL